MALTAIKLLTQIAAAVCLCAACAQVPAKNGSLTPLDAAAASKIAPEQCGRVASVSVGAGHILPNYVAGGDAKICWR